MLLKFIDLENLRIIEIEEEDFLKNVGVLYGDSYYVEVYNKELKKTTTLYHRKSIRDIDYEAKGNYVISTKSWNYLFEKLKGKNIILMSYDTTTVRERYFERLLGELDEE